MLKLARQLVKVFIFSLVFCGFISLLTSCGSLANKSPFSIFSSRKGEQATSEKKLQLPILQRPDNGDPFILQVLSEQFDGNELVLTIGFASFEDADYKAVIIRLMTQRAGDILQTKEFIVQDLFDSYGTFGSHSAKLEQTFQYKFGLSIPAAQGSEYQLELLWGDDALPFLKNQSKNQGRNLNPDQEQGTSVQKNATNSQGLSGLTNGRQVPLPDSKVIELQGLRISKKRFCHKKEECQIEFQIAAEIVNLSNEIVKSAVMAVGFLDKEGEAYKYGVRIPEDEELVELPNLSLMPQNSQSIKLVLDQRVPESMENRYQPVLRLVQSAQNAK